METEQFSMMGEQPSPSADGHCAGLLRTRFRHSCLCPSPASPPAGFASLRGRSKDAEDSGQGCPAESTLCCGRNCTSSWISLI